MLLVAKVKISVLLHVKMAQNTMFPIVLKGKNYVVVLRMSALAMQYVIIKPSIDCFRIL